MLNGHPLPIVNAAFHLAGAIAFGIFLTLALRGATHRRLRENWLAIGAAGLAWIWNAGSFFVLLLHPGGLQWGVEAIGFSALSLLPAVLLQFSLAGKMRPVAAAGYVVAGIAISMHLLEDVWPGADLHRRGLFTITAGFATLRSQSEPIAISRKTTGIDANGSSFLGRSFIKTSRNTGSSK